MKYRAEIDGLRAVAVCSVVLYHAFPTWMPGGFLGVDIFFVISGYLISRILLEEIQAGRFSLINFYERRFRRIFPALIVVIVAVLLASSLISYPKDFLDSGVTAVAALLSFSNLYLLATVNYFGAIDQKPLLHTWSLGVEEQFYIFFPLFLGAVTLYAAKYLKTMILALFALSLACSLLFSSEYPMASFYGPHARAWELLAGSILAAQILPIARGSVVANFLSVLGMALIVLALFGYEAMALKPAEGSIPAVAGAFLLIYSTAGNTTWIARLLSLAPAVFVGKISYSLYLWHWPILKLLFLPAVKLVVLTGVFPELRPSTVTVGLVIFSFVAAFLSWKLVEQPFRKSEAVSTKTMMIFGASGSLIILGAALSIYVSGGWPQRFSPDVIQLARYADAEPQTFNEGSCFITQRFARTDFDASQCLTLKADRPNFLLLGDSHAAHLWRGLQDSLDANLMQATASGCKPTIQHAVGDRTACTSIMDFVFNEFLTTQKVDLLILSARWRPSDVPRLEKTIDYLQSRGVKVIILGPIVEYQYQLPYILADARRSNDPTFVAKMKVRSQRKLDGEVRRVVQQHGAAYISIYDIVCPADVCRETTDDGIPFQFDYGHLTAEAAEIVGAKIVNSDEFKSSTVAKDKISDGQ